MGGHCTLTRSQPPAPNWGSRKVCGSPRAAQGSFLPPCLQPHQVEMKEINKSSQAFSLNLYFSFFEKSSFLRRSFCFSSKAFPLPSHWFALENPSPVHSAPTRPTVTPSTEDGALQQGLTNTSIWKTVGGITSLLPQRSALGLG